MASLNPIPPNIDTVLLFGSQALSFDEASFRQLSSTILSSPTHAWVLRTIDELPELWPSICDQLPKLRTAPGAAHLADLGTCLRTGTIPTPSLPNILLSPLVVIAQLTQYATYAASRDPEALPPSEAVGFCIGLLSAFAVGASSRKSELERYAAAAVRIALLVGALVDVKDGGEERGAESTTVTVGWKNADGEEALGDVLKRYPGTYISVSYDENRASVTTFVKSLPALQKDLSASGLAVAEIGLRGRFHTPAHKAEFEELVAFCNSHPDFALPDARTLTIPSRSNSGDGFVTDGALHEVALRAILVEHSKWYQTFSEVKSTHVLGNAKVICFGPERCIPPSLLRGIAQQVVYPEDHAPVLRSPNDIAVVGMSINVAGANDPEEFWQLLASGKSQHRLVPPGRFSFDTVFRDKDTSRTWYGNFIDNVDAFDHKFFKKTPRESASMDPQQRLLMQVAYQAVEQSGYFHSPETVDKHIGCYVGLCGTDYDSNIACHQPNAFTATGSLRGFIAGKVSHYFGWTGPGVTVDTACSGSAVAIHQACSAILSGECTAALASGTNIMTQPLIFQNLAGASFLSTTGQCKPFDALADGYCRGEAVAAVFLKKMSASLADGDQILGVISGTAVYQNQNCTPIVVPNAPSLSDLFRNVLSKANLTPDRVSVVEAHGTGTPVGDPAEYESVKRVFSGFPRASPLQLGSVKGLVGHTEGTSGAVSLIKVLMMMQKGYVPPQASHSKMNPAIKATVEDRIEVTTRLQPWAADFKAALINNYGASGSNASMVVTQGPKVRKSSAQLPSDLKYPFWISGLDERSIRAYATGLRSYLKNTTASIGDLSFNLARQSNRSFEQALIFSCRSLPELDQKLAAVEQGASTATPKPIPVSRLVILCFGGQISTSLGLDRQVYDSVAVLRKYLDQCDAVARKLGAGSIFPAVFQQHAIEDIVSLQVALFALQYSTAKSWIECGVRPVAVVGHSFGELSALAISGVLGMQETMKIIIGRATLIRDAWGQEKGSMLAVEADVHEVNKLLSDSGTPATIACFNGPRSHTVAGSVESIDAVVQTINSKYAGLRFKRLNVSNAFHSTLVEALMPELRKLGEGLTFHKAIIPLERATETQSDDSFPSDFVATHLRNPVYFNHAVQRLAKQYPSAIWLEAGSNATVTAMASKALGAPKGNHFQAVNVSGTQGLQKLVDTTLSLWEAGLRAAHWSHSKTQTYEYATLSLPPYQFDRSRHWLELKEPPKLAAALANHVEAQTKGSLPTSLYTFTAYQDTKQRLARFRFNTMIPQYEEIVAGHTIAGTAPICPATVQIDVAIEALRSLHTELAAPSMFPQVRNVTNLVPICVDPSRSVWLDVEALDSPLRTWFWKMVSTGAAGAAPTTHVTGEIVFRSEDDLQYHLEFARYERLVSHRRCMQVLHREDADEVIQGRSIYRVFSDVVDYGSQYFGLQKLVGKGNESAGRVVKKHSGKTWLDAFLSDAFCQVGGIWVNCMTDRDPNEIYIANGIEQWVRSPKVFKDGTIQTEKWHVFGSHTRAADGNSFLSDLFIFDAKTERLAEVVLGINYAKVSRASMGKLLGRLTAPGTAGPVTTTFDPAPIQIPVPKEAGSAKGVPSKPAGDNSGLVKKLKLILADISGLEVEEIKDTVDLADIGVDSLMGMEMAREIETAFKCTLPQDELGQVTDFPSLLKCVKNALGAEGDDYSEGVTPDTSGESDYSPPGSVISESTLPSTPEEDHPKRPRDLEIQQSVILEAFGEAKLRTDELIKEHNAQGYLSTVIPKQDQFCVALTVEAFRELGCDLATAKQGQELEPVPRAPDQEKLAQYLYRMLEETRIVDLDDGKITRTHVALPGKSSSELLQDLNKNYPDHTCSNELAYWTGSHLAGILTGKEDGIKLIFGTNKGRELVAGVYADFPLNKLYYKQMGEFLSNLLLKVHSRPGQGPLKILEMGAGTGATTKVLVPLLASLGVPVEYTFTDLASSFVAAARKRFKQYPFMKYRVHDIENPPADDLVHSQHIVIASNAIHATHSLPGSTANIRRMLRPDGLLMMLEMTQPMFWCDIIFGVFEGWWLFEDGRDHAVASPRRWEKDLHSVGYGHVDWSEGHSPEVALERVIIATASGSQLDRLPVGPAPPKNETWNHDKRREAVNEYVRKATEGFKVPIRSNEIAEPENVNVFITGATGSLGAHLVAHFARLSHVGKVFCLNRRSGSDPETRQRQSLASKGIDLDKNLLSKLQVYETDTSKPMLGLSQEIYNDLTSQVTHIIHNAWPMNAKRPLHTFASQFQVLRNLIDLSSEISSRRPSTAKVTFQLISSIATVGHYPLHMGTPHIPEDRMTIESVLPNGYGDAKFVCELMLDETLHKHPERFRTMVVRLGQVAGSSSSGYWNEREHFAFLIKSSQTLRALPELHGPVSWTPVDDVAGSCAELALQEGDPKLFYHIDNPVRQPWEEMLPILADALDIPENRIISFEEWIRRVRAFPGDVEKENPAKLLVDFLEEDFRRMSCGGVLLGTQKSCADSETMRGVGAVGKEVVRRYVEAWRKCGFLW